MQTRAICGDTQLRLSRAKAPSRPQLVGEQPGEEDLRGKAFVGPAGKVLDDAFTAAGLARDDLFITNAVKHFKWTPGKRRLHKRPDVSEITACNVWLDREIASVQAARHRCTGRHGVTCLDRPFRIDRVCAPAVASPPKRRGCVVCHYHPSAISRP